MTHNLERQSEHAWEGAAVDGDVLAGDESRLRRAQERAGCAKTLEIAKTPGGNAGDARLRSD
jgi:hypothetical protein